MTDLGTDRTMTPELRERLEDELHPMPGTIGGAVDRLEPVIASVDANAHARGRAEVAAEIVAKLRNRRGGQNAIEAIIDEYSSEADAYPGGTD